MEIKMSPFKVMKSISTYSMSAISTQEMQQFCPQMFEHIVNSVELDMCSGKEELVANQPNNIN